MSDGEESLDGVAVTQDLSDCTTINFSNSHLYQSRCNDNNDVNENWLEPSICSVLDNNSLTKGNYYNKTRQIQKAICNVSFLLQNWDCKLLFDIMLYGTTYTPKYNILSFLDEKYKLFPSCVYFPQSKYPITDGFSGVGWKNLVKDLTRSALHDGYNIFCNGYSGGKSSNYPCKQSRVFKCRHGVVYRGNVVDRKLIDNYRKTIAINDRTNGRGPEGKKLPRRSSTYRSLNKQQCCPFTFKVSFDVNGFFIVNGYGCCSHHNHPKVASDKYIFSPRLLYDQEKKIAKSICDANVNMGVVKSVIYKRTGHTVTLQACHYLSSLNDDLKRMANLSELSSADTIIDFLKSKKYDYITLFNSAVTDRNSIQSPLMSENNLTSERLYSNTSFVIPPNERRDAVEFTEDNRSNRNLTNEQHLLVAIAWVLPSEKRLFMLFPEAIFVDVVEDTNNEGRPLLTMTGCDGDGKMYTFLRAFLPNQRAWGFRWVFSHVLMTMFPRETLAKIQIIISDGDAQEYHQIDNLINQYLGNIVRVRCAWHVIERGWQRRGPKIPPNLKSKHYKDIVYLCKHWLYSWTNSACENMCEYNISRQLFEHYLYSPDVVSVVGHSFGMMVLDFVRQHVEPILPQLFFFKRKHLRHFDQNMNVKHEGTFRGLKYGCTPIGPSLGLQKSLITISNVGERKCGTVHKQKTRDVLTTKTWVNLRCSNKLNLRGEQLMCNEWDLRNNYNSIHCSPTQWLIRYAPSTNNNVKTYRTVYPLFNRIRTVSIETNYFVCSCKYFERFGIPCRHIFHVFATFTDYKEPSHYDISVIYWKQYMHYCYNNQCTKSDKDSRDLCKLLEHLRKNDIKGPSCPRSLYESLPVVKTIPVEFNDSIIRCNNYNINELQNLEIMNIPSGYGMTMSQNSIIEIDETSTCENNSDQCNILMNLNNTFNSNALEFMNTHEENCMRTSSFNVYSELNPLFKTLVSHLQEHGDEESISSVKGFLRNALNEIQVKKQKTARSENGSLISSNMNYIKRRKTHGTNHFA